MRDLDVLFMALARSEFRSRFRLSEQDRRYVMERSLATIRSHARDLIQRRLAPANPANDGRQTPMRGHPVFVAQHATGTCCRECLAKWHRIAPGRQLSERQIDYVVDVLQRWIARQVPSAPERPEAVPDRQKRLFSPDHS